MRAKASGLMLAVLHQHTTSNEPVLAGAHSLVPPQSGQMRLGSGVVGDMVAVVSKQWRWLWLPIRPKTA
jgi:hypothetical protein